MIAHDKSLHLLAGAAVALLVYAIALTTIRDHAALAGLLAAVVVGVGKEVYDKFTPGRHVEFADAAATVAGGGVIFITSMLPKWI